MEHVVQLSTVHDSDDSRIFHKMCKTLVRAGYRVTYVVPADYDHVRDGVQIKALSKPKNRLERFRLGAKAFRTCLDLKADLYHFHDPELLSVGARIHVLSGRPVIFDVHEYFAKGLLTKPWLLPTMRKLVAATYPIVERHYVKCLQGIIAVNDDMAHTYRLYNPRSISVYNYPDLNGFSQEAPRPRRGVRTSKVLIHLGSINQDRGLETLLDTIRIVNRSHVDAVLRIVGRIDDRGLSDSCRHKLEQLQGSPNFDHVQQVAYSEVARHLNEAAIGLIPLNGSQENEEGLPRKMFEYMLFGLPIVASDLGRLAKVIRQSDAGLLAKAGDPTQFAAAINLLLGDAALQERLGENGRMACLTSYNWDSQANKLLKLYDELLHT